ncbi:ANTAR domain-containing protein [Streptomyces sp. NBC_00285]|uniref:ANTAR domain-containing protein n=1 Tax=Streptomyces sp. NBC_00285 TaxID=2975700 RepID=UPI002E290982|nr:ANTAR domain-containing protein [Streptomyces sp. NBC_00285]
MPEPAHSAQPLIARDVRPPCLATVESAVAGDRMGVTCRGEFDVGAEWLQPELHAALDRSATGVDLDLSEVGFCDCGGLNVLLGLRRAALDQGKTVAVRVCSPAVGRLLDLTGARELFVAEETRNAEEPEYADDPAPPDTEAVRALHDASRLVDVDDELRLEVAQLRRAMRTRPAIDVARGIVMASFGLSAEDAWTVLVTASQNTNTKVHQLARGLVGAVHGAAVPEEVRQQMAVAVAKVRQTPAPSEAIAVGEPGTEVQDASP